MRKVPVFDLCVGTYGQGIQIMERGRMLKPFFLTPEEGARTAIFLASDDSVKDITGEYFYKCQLARSSRRSKDPYLARRLFRLSMSMTGLTPYITYV